MHSLCRNFQHFLPSNLARTHTHTTHYTLFHWPMSTCKYTAKLACMCAMKSVNQFIRLERRTWWNWLSVIAVLMQHPADRPLISAIDPLCAGRNTEYPRAVMGVQTHQLLGHNNLHLKVCWTSIPLHWQHRVGGEGIALMDETGTNERGQWVGTVSACVYVQTN